MSWSTFKESNPFPFFKNDDSSRKNWWRFIDSKHVNTHNRSFRCKFPNCDSRFYRSRDVTRHELSCDRNPKPCPREFKCTSQDCEYAIKGFSRRDNCVRHIKNMHHGHLLNDLNRWSFHTWVLFLCVLFHFSGKVDWLTDCSSFSYLGRWDPKILIFTFIETRVH
jgi:hypothetical protein